MPIKKLPHSRSLSLIFSAIFLLGFVNITAGCLSAGGAGQSARQTGVTTHSYASDSPSVQRVEIIHFHTDQYCDSCERVGDFAEETVTSAYPDELASGKIAFMHVNVDDPASRNFVEKYGATGSSLWIGVYDKTGFHKTEDLKVWYLIPDKDAFSSYLRGVIDSRLSGEPA